MQIQPLYFRNQKKGYALLITLAFLAVSLILYASIASWSVSNANITLRHNLFNDAEAAAEAGTENVFSQMQRDFVYANLKDPSNYTPLYPTPTGWPIQFSFSDTNGTANQTSIPDYGTKVYTYLNAPYTGLQGWREIVIIGSKATPINQLYTVSATVVESAEADIIPIVQFAVFYNIDLDISPGQPMNINGKVFSNANIYLFPYADMNFNNTVASVGDTYSGTENPYTQQATNSSSYDAPAFNDGDPVSGVKSLTLPVGTSATNSSGTVTNSAASVEAILQMPPSGTDPDSTAGQTYLVNKADIILSNSAAGVITAYFQDSNSISRLTQIPYDTNYITISGSTRTTNPIYSFVTNTTFYDYRESDTVQAMQVNVGQLNTWLNNTNGLIYDAKNKTDKGHPINSIYAINNKPLTASQIPGVRMVNGAQLPSAGLTVATPDPMYVEGDYNIRTNTSGPTSAQTTNTAYTEPAMLMADAITILSSAWNDSDTSSTSLSSRTPVNTTINAAALEGIVISTNDASGNNHYSGGLENFMRLEENWDTATTLQYNGSIIVMFPSQYATNFWQVPGNYYNPPTRHWAFDLNFTQLNKQPPMCPSFKVLNRTGWTAY
jgi:hypothetical protein